MWSDQPHTVQLWKAVESRTRAQMYRLAPRHQHASEVAREHAYLVEQFLTGDGVLIAKALEDHVVTSARELLGQDPDGHRGELPPDCATPAEPPAHSRRLR